jgi:hypothetical protein
MRPQIKSPENNLYVELKNIQKDIFENLKSHK